ncbi:MAG: tRNA guanosine(15) transglycosylase TgtA [Candidatus Altiarchaeota archaeon]|nr:tRNA guanosine(15) transglycosylase TgtA [Candidatus Altiarchaeota archaeon]
MRFEIRDHDGLGRLGKLRINQKRVETPAFVPVIQPRHQTIPGTKLSKLGVEMVITNAYIIHQDSALSQQAKNGIHKFLDFNGAVMTDSGAYQLLMYGKVDVTNQEIIEFQKKIGTDIGVILDVPPGLDLPENQVAQHVKTTITRAKEAKQLDWGNTEFVYPAHGAPYWSILEKSIKAGEKLGYGLFGLGGIVPKMMNYRFDEVILSQKMLKQNWLGPVHMFGLGHPMLIPLAVLFGADTFDSASHHLFAQDDRIITQNGTRKLEETEFLAGIDVSELKQLGGRERREALAEYNLIQILDEVERVKQAIIDGRLWEYTHQSVMAHPNLMEAFIQGLQDRPFKKTEPAVKRKAFFYQTELSLEREEVVRHFEKLDRILPDTVRVVDIDDFGAGKCVVHPVFGLIPWEIRTVYPLMQNEFPNSVCVLKTTKNRLAELLKNRTTKSSTKSGLLPKHEKIMPIPEKASFEKEMEMRFKYQFGKKAKGIFKGVRPVYSRTGRLSELRHKRDLFAVIRARDGWIIPKELMFDRMPNIKWIDVEESLKGKSSILTPGIKGYSKNILAKDFVEIRNGKKRVGLGIARLGSAELGLLGGVGVQIEFWSVTHT